MEIKLSRGKIQKSFLKKIKTQANNIKSMNNILLKLKNENYFEKLKNSFSEILFSEMNFSIKKIYMLSKKKNNLNLKNLILENSFCFKENLKLIGNYIGFLIS